MNSDIFSLKKRLKWARTKMERVAVEKCDALL